MQTWWGPGNRVSSRSPPRTNVTRCPVALKRYEGVTHDGCLRIEIGRLPACGSVIYGLLACRNISLIVSSLLDSQSVPTIRLSLIRTLVQPLKPKFGLTEERCCFGNSRHSYIYGFPVLRELPLKCYLLRYRFSPRKKKPQWETNPPSAKRRLSPSTPTT